LQLLCIVFGCNVSYFDAVKSYNHDVHITTYLPTYFTPLTTDFFAMTLSQFLAASCNMRHNCSHYLSSVSTPISHLVRRALYLWLADYCLTRCMLLGRLPATHVLREQPWGGMASYAQATHYAHRLLHSTGYTQSYRSSFCVSSLSTRVACLLSLAKMADARVQTFHVCQANFFTLPRKADTPSHPVNA